MAGLGAISACLISVHHPRDLQMNKMNDEVHCKFTFQLVLCFNLGTFAGFQIASCRILLFCLFSDWIDVKIDGCSMTAIQLCNSEQSW